MSRANGGTKLDAIRLPAEAFAAALADIDHLAELKLTLHCLAALQQKEGQYRYLRYDELREDKVLLRALGGGRALDDALRRAVKRGTLLEAHVNPGRERQRLFTWNDDAGRAWQAQIRAGRWQPVVADEIQVLPQRLSLYELYEDNIGALTPMIAEAIKDAESSYPRQWIEDALRYAVERNARNWRYIVKVLEAWRQEGRSHEESGRNPGRHKRYTAGKWKDFIES